jgi:phthalate 4,5-dioxygenase
MTKPPTPTLVLKLTLASLLRSTRSANRASLLDRTNENLVSTDNGIIMARHRLLRAAKALAEKGLTPPGVDLAHQRVRSASLILPPEPPFKDAAREALVVRPGVAPSSV